MERVSKTVSARSFLTGWPNGREGEGGTAAGGKAHIFGQCRKLNEWGQRIKKRQPRRNLRGGGKWHPEVGEERLEGMRKEKERGTRERDPPSLSPEGPTDKNWGRVHLRAQKISLNEVKLEKIKAKAQASAATEGGENGTGKGSQRESMPSPCECEIGQKPTAAANN
ncbi:hypothetical protein niasHT_028545 [Heterodera trifolii]|uniref:Uncharacterized protein n=1 Tax=Heterodera trifolii TaxID=157864 RepID=A0ABD2KQ58_9BILA